MNEQWQELKETIMELRDNDGTGTQQETCKFLTNLMDVLEKQMEEPKAEWFPCSEKLPEEPGVYLVSMNRLGYPQREVDGFVCGRWERFGNDVIAWCEIPEPY